jgi:hypothetical protein
MYIYLCHSFVLHAFSLLKLSTREQIGYIFFKAVGYIDPLTLRLYELVK